MSWWIIWKPCGHMARVWCSNPSTVYFRTNYMNNKKKSGCFRFQHFLEKAKVEIRNLFRFKSFKVGKKISRSLSPEISMLRRSLKVNLFFKSRILRAGSLFFSKIWGLVLYTTVLYRTILRVFFFEFDLMYCDLWWQYIKVWKLFKGGNYSRKYGMCAVKC